MSNREAIINSNLVGGHGYLFIISVISFAIYGYFVSCFSEFLIFVSKCVEICIVGLYDQLEQTLRQRS